MVPIAIGTDHRGYYIKEQLLGYRQIAHVNIEWLDVGCFSPDRTDYPLYAVEVCKLIKQKKALYGVLLCGSGIGMSIVANRFSGIYAGLSWDLESAAAAKADDNINIIVLPTDRLNFEAVVKILETWLTTPFKEGRYLERLKLIEKLTQE